VYLDAVDEVQTSARALDLALNDAGEGVVRAEVPNARKSDREAEGLAGADRSGGLGSGEPAARLGAVALH